MGINPTGLGENTCHTQSTFNPTRFQDERNARVGAWIRSVQPDEFGEGFLGSARSNPACKTVYCVFLYVSGLAGIRHAQPGQNTHTKRGLKEMRCYGTHRALTKSTQYQDATSDRCWCTQDWCAPSRCNWALWWGSRPCRLVKKYLTDLLVHCN
jgi:hypothetical protein